MTDGSAGSFAFGLELLTLPGPKDLYRSSSQEDLRFQYAAELLQPDRF